MESVLLVAPITALEFLGEDLLLAGEGPDLSVYGLHARPSTRATLGVLRSHRVHGIRPQPAGQEGIKESPWQETVLAVFGGKAVRRVAVRNGRPPALERRGPMLELQDWVLDVRWLTGDGGLMGVALAHNTVLLLEGRGQTLSRCEDGCLLYSALLLGHRWEHCVLVGGTVFNQLVMWKPGGGKPKGGEVCRVERRLHGHCGVIFSLGYLPERGWLASASDDRSVRLWGVGSLGEGEELGAESPSCLRVLYGHQARVFAVRPTRGSVFSAGEDGACLQWDASSGNVARAFRGHRVGGVRALAVSRGCVATGGADGGIRMWRLGEGEALTPNVALRDMEFRGRGCPKVVRLVGGGVAVGTDKGEVLLWKEGVWELLWEGGPAWESYCVMELLPSMERGEAAGLCALGNLGGAVRVFPILRQGLGVELRAGKGKIHSLLWEEGGYLLASGAEGLVYRWLLEAEPAESAHSQNIKATALCPFRLPPCAKRWLLCVTLVSRLGEMLWVCGDRRGSLLLFGPLRDGEEGDVPVSPVSVLFGVHGKQGVTSVCERDGLIYSTGRDGCVRVAKLEGEALVVLRVQRACPGMEWVEQIWFPERTEEAGGGSEFVVAGFRSVHFVVWDASRREQLLCVPCGGGHRSWSYQRPLAHTPEWLAFLKQGAVLACSPQQSSVGWDGSSSWLLREGLHGRGVGCICHLGTVQGWDVLASGGEDTTVTVFALHPRTSRFTVLSLLSDHISSVRALAATLPLPAMGDRQLSVLLFSAGGRAQLQCYRLLIGADVAQTPPSCQVVQIAGHRLDEHWEKRRNRHKTIKMDPETRYMSIAVVHAGKEQVFLALACSDGALRIFSVEEGSRRILLLWENFHHQRCVLSVASCCLSDAEGKRRLFVMSAATDGRIALWDMSTLTSTTNCSSSTLDWEAPPGPCLTVPVHQSGVNALLLWEEPSRENPTSHCLSVASGGDDGQLSVTRIQLRFHQQPAGGDSDFTALHHSSLSVPLAHAAPLTALQLLSPNILATTSPDQRVCLWSLCDSSLSPGGVLFSHIADATALASWDHWVAVCGQGLQLVQIKDEEGEGGE